MGLRWFTATVLLVVAAIIGLRFKSYRPFNLSVLALLALNGVVGVCKLVIGRTKPRLYVDELHANGMSYPSGHASNAILTWGLFACLSVKYSAPSRFRTNLAISTVSAITVLVVLISLFRNTHWLSDLVGGVSIGTALLLLIVAIDRVISSRRLAPVIEVQRT